MSAPVRIRLSRAKGFDLQAHSKAVNGLEAINVVRPSIFGNPFIVGKDGTREECVSLFGHMLNGVIAITASPRPDDIILRRAAILGNIRRLTGKNLACWCRFDGKPCHADALLEIANDEQKLLRCDEIAGRTLEDS